MIKIQAIFDPVEVSFIAQSTSIHIQKAVNASPTMTTPAKPNPESAGMEIELFMVVRPLVSHSSTNGSIIRGVELEGRRPPATA